MNTELLDQLLHQQESESLDFKRDQYAFESTTNDAKSELLKDILAFANSWCLGDAYILVGVDEKKGGRSNIVGVSEHLDDAKLQQFVNKKTNRPISFSYRPFTTPDGNIGIIHISKQERPFFLHRDFGKLKAREVYVRRGSATDEATPDEVLSMGRAATGQVNASSLDLSFADSKSEEFLGKFVTVRAGLLKFDPSELPYYGNPPSMFGNILSEDNREFYRERAAYEQQTQRIRGFRFGVENTGGTLLSNVRIKIIGELNGSFIFRDALPRQPKQQIDRIGEIDHRRLRNSLGRSRSIAVRAKRDCISCTCEMLDIQPKAKEVSDDIFYVGGTEAGTYDLQATVFADNLSEPAQFVLTVNIETRDLTLDVETFIKRFPASR